MAKSANALPNITLFGDDLDRVMSGVITPGLKEAARQERQRMLEESHFDLPASAESTATPFTPKPHAPLIAVMSRDVCRCGKSYSRFGYLARLTIETIEGGTIERLTAVAETVDKPERVKWERHDIPYCPECI